MDAVVDALSEHFGFDAFRPGQRPVVDAIRAGKPVVAVMPTGAGKSLCYQLPAVMLPGVTLVVSPLIALMKDQVDALQALGIEAAYVNSSQDPETQRAVLQSALDGHLKLLYVAPERFRFGGAMAMMRRLPIARFVVDEAHCISAWGHDFRPDYLLLGDVIRDLGGPPVSAFTATATARVREDIARSLGLPDPLVVVHGFLRENLHLSVVPIRKMAEKDRHIAAVLRQEPGAVVVYCATRRHCEEVGERLRRKNVRVGVYHAGLDDEARREVQEAFMADRLRVIVATNAFGMGIDKAKVRVVIHYDIPGSLEAYYQQAGRAGRDGERSLCLLLFTYADTRIHEFFIEKGGEDLPADRYVSWADAERRKLKAMVRYAYADSCRHSVILQYFGERLTIGSEGCGACDRCTGDTGIEGLALSAAAGPSRRVAGASSRRAVEQAHAEKRDLDEDEAVIVQKVLSAVARARGRLTSTELARILKGSSRAEVLEDALADSKSYGILSGLKQKELTGLLASLRRAGCVRGTRPVLTDVGAEVMWRRQDVQLDVPPFSEKKRSKKTASTPPVQLSADDRGLVEAMKVVRLDAARERGVPAYVIASNRLLEAIAAARPGDDAASWLAVKGVGPVNVDALREVLQPTLDAAVDEANAAQAAIQPAE